MSRATRRTIRSRAPTDMSGTRVDVPYVRPTLPPFDTLAPDLERIISSGQLTKGPFAREYEAALADRLGVRNVIATSSCTIGLALLYRAVRIDGPVVVPSFTFMATVNALVWAGGTPVFVDVDAASWTLDPEKVDDACSSDVSAIVGVPVFGTPCANDRLAEIASRRGVDLLYDSAHGVGSSFHGVPLGRFGRAEVFSTTPTKTLVTGEGGFITTDDDDLAEELRMLIEYGNDGGFDTYVPGLNGRLPEISALIGLRMLDELDRAMERRLQIVATYANAFRDVDGLTLQVVPEGCVSSFKDFTVLVGDRFGRTRDGLHAYLAEQGVQTKRYFCPVVHRQRPYRSLGSEGMLPVTERLEREALSLPLWSAMTSDQIDHVIGSVLTAARTGSHR